MIPTSDSKNGLSTFLSFGAKSVQPAILEKMLVGRLQTADLLEQYARQIADNGVNNQVFIVGPRGSGKTHLLRVLYHRITDLVQEKRVIVAYFAEEEYGISGYLDFLIRIINAFMRWYDVDKPALETQLNILRETPESRQEYIAEKLISDYVGDKPLLILSENFDAILEALGRNGQGKLRAWLYRHNRISIMATAQATSPDLGREDRPFYGFFSTIKLKKLSYEDSLTLLTTLAETEKNEKMLTHLAGKGRGQVRAIHELVKGNHRLLVTFYEFLKADTLADLSVVFMKTMNDLKPYYETFIRFLPAQQQKILHYLALAKIPQKGTDIGKNCFIATASLTKQLSELQRRHLIDALPDFTDKRNKLYDVSEPLLRIAIEIGEQREGITALFVDFMALWYSHDELKTQKAYFESLYLVEERPSQKQKLYYEIYAREKALELKTHIESESASSILKAIFKKLESGNFEAAISEAEEMPLSRRDANYHFLVGYTYILQGKNVESVQAILKAIELDSDNSEFIKHLGVAYSRIGDYDNAIEAYKEVIQADPGDPQTWYNLAIALHSKGDSIDATDAYKKALHLKPNFAEAWYNLGDIYRSKQNYEQAIDAYRNATELDKEKREAWYNLGISYNAQKEYYGSIDAYSKALNTGSEASVKNHVIWNNLGIVYGNLGDLNKAGLAYTKAIECNSNDFWAWNNLGVTNLSKGLFQKAISNFQKAHLLRPNEHGIWHNLGLAYQAQRDYTQAIMYYQKASEIDPKQKETNDRLAATVIDFLKSNKTDTAELIDLEVWFEGKSTFSVLSTYINIYRRVVFDKEEKALYELPKEQRIFFEREILRRNVE